MRLRRSDSAGQGYRRVARGRGFGYLAPDGAVVKDGELKARFDALVIPPAWHDVWIAPFANGHIQAMGLDAAGRRQYLYHPSWRDRMDKIKYDRALALAESLPSARRRVTMDLRRDGLGRERVLAAGFRMLDTGSLRVGSERYALEHGSHGLTTLLCAHASTSGSTVHLTFPGKSGQNWDSEIDDTDLVAVVRALKRRGGRARLLSWHDGGAWLPVSAEDLNAYVRERTGGEFTAKDFRTLHGTVAAAVSLARTGPQRTASGRKRAESQAIRAASEILGNTPAIARSSYVDPRVLDDFRHGKTIDPHRIGSAESELRAMLFG